MPRRIVASFRRAPEARAAVLALERKGLVDANDIRVVGAPRVAPMGGQGEVDAKVVGEHAWHFGIGAAIAAVLFWAVTFGALVVFGVPVVTAMALALIAAIPGFFIGGFWGVAADLPVTDEAFDTYVAELAGYDGPVEVEVMLDHDVDPEQVATMLRERHPTDLRFVA